MPAKVPQMEMALKYQKRCVGQGSCGQIKIVDLVDRKASEFYVMRSSGTNGNRGSTGLKTDSLCKLCKRQRVRVLEEARGEAGIEARRAARERYKRNNRIAFRRQRRDHARRRRGWVDPIPFCEWLQEFVTARRGVVENMPQRIGARVRPIYRAATIAEASGIKKSVVENILRGRIPQRLTLKEVDAALVFCGAEYMLTILYPLSQKDREEDFNGHLKGHAAIQEALGGQGEGNLTS